MITTVKGGPLDISVKKYLVVWLIIEAQILIYISLFQNTLDNEFGAEHLLLKVQ